MQPSPLTSRFWSKVDQESNAPCWLWIAATMHHGYGSAWHDGQFWQAHRLSYTVHRGPIAAGLVLDHTCRTPRCVRPDHLEPVPQRTNILRGGSFAAVNASKTACDNGHDFAEHGYVSKAGRRICRPCTRERQRRWLANRKV